MTALIGVNAFSKVPTILLIMQVTDQPLPPLRT